jgi:hypothetical protein
MSDHGPAGRHFADHSVQNVSVACKAAWGLIGGGGGRCEGAWVSTNGTVSPAPIVNSATVRMFSPRKCTGVRSNSMSGPAMARSVPSGKRVTQGTIAP